MDDSELRLDGNAAGGILQTLFGFDLTTVLTTCGGCAAQAQVGALHVYRHGMGTIVRCARCNNVLIRVAYLRGHYWLDLSGMRSLRIAIEA